MKTEFQLNLQACLDGELPESQAREVKARLAADAEAGSLLQELEWTKQALTGADLAPPLPESREFYWSKIEREIQRLEAADTRAGAERRSAKPWWKRFWVPATGLAALTVLMGITLAQMQFQLRGHATALETTLDDSGAFTYRDQKAGVTLVWLSYPPDRVLAQNDEDDTLE